MINIKSFPTALILVVMVLIMSCLLLGTLPGCSRTSATEPGLPIEQVSEKVSSEDLSQYFEGIPNGSFVLFDKNSKAYSIYNLAQSQLRVSPCSTFKIPNSLIGLESGVLQDENTLFKWDGKKNNWGIDSWNQDHTLTSAFANSVVWYYQKVAEMVGKDKMQQYLNTLDYGNKNISGGITQFWLDSSLKISPLEQVVFLRKFYDYQLPFSQRNVDIVKKIMIKLDNNGVKLSGKAGQAGDHLNWFVGYVESNDNVYFFATNLQGKNIGDNQAVKITDAILKAKGILR